MQNTIRIIEIMQKNQLKMQVQNKKFQNSIDSTIAIPYNFSHEQRRSLDSIRYQLECCLRKILCDECLYLYVGGMDCERRNV